MGRLLVTLFCLSSTLALAQPEPGDPSEWTLPDGLSTANDRRIGGPVRAPAASVASRRDPTVTVATSLRSRHAESRWGHQLALGLLGNVAGGVVGGLVGAGLSCIGASSAGSWCAIVGAVVGIPVGAILGATGGVLIAGTSPGHGLVTFLGVLAGAVLSLVTGPGVFLAMAAFPAIGGVIAYEVARQAALRAEQAVTAPPLQPAVGSVSVAPFTTRDGGGGVVLAAVF